METLCEKRSFNQGLTKERDSHLIGGGLSWQKRGKGGGRSDPPGSKGKGGVYPIPFH